MRVFLVFLALLIASPAAAQKLKGVNLSGSKGPKLKKKKKKAGGDSVFEIKGLEVTSVKGKRFELQASLFKPGRQAQNPFVIYFVDGRRKNEVHRSNARFSGSRGGFTNSVTVDLSRFNPRRGHLEAVIPGCNKAKCKKVVRLRGGDLFIDGRPTIESRGSDRILKLDIKNAGPSPMANCKVAIEIEGRKVKDIPLRNLAVNGKKGIEFRYRGKANKPYKAKIACRDLGTGNNVLSGRLK